MANIKFGDVIYVERDCGIFGYKHFGVYSGDKKVIHYTKDNNSSDCMNGIIRETSLKRFLDGDNNCYAVDFDKFGHRTGDHEVDVPSHGLGSNVIGGSINIFEILRLGKSIYDLLFGEERKLYSPEETVRRAREHTKAGKNRGYNLFLNNCEHFAIWCKTGIAESEQVNELLQALLDHPNGTTLARIY